MHLAKGTAPIVSLAALAALGAIVAALTIAPTASASWDWTNLPAGYHVVDASNGPCPDGSGATQHWITLNGTQIFPSTCDSGFQAALDAYVDSTICTVNPQAGGAACAPTTTAAPTDTVATTTTAVDTSTTTTAAPPATTDPANTPPATTTVDPAAAGQTTTALTPNEQSLQDQIDKLAAQISALTSRVDRLDQASVAAQLAYQQAIANGDTPDVAAEIARGIGMNVIFGLGDFAP